MSKIVFLKNFKVHITTALFFIFVFYKIIELLLVKSRATSFDLQCLLFASIIYLIPVYFLYVFTIIKLQDRLFISMNFIIKFCIFIFNFSSSELIIYHVIKFGLFKNEMFLIFTALTLILNFIFLVASDDHHLLCIIYYFLVTYLISVQLISIYEVKDLIFLSKKVEI